VGQLLFGSIVVSETSPGLVLAIARTTGVALKRYRMQTLVEEVGAV
jgi:hypothetical protein